ILSRKSDETAFPMKHLLLTENQTEHQMGTRRFKLFAGCSRRWVPWICAYTGARVNEITQLRRQDIKQIDGI
ncbi:hypothetical protein, partial [Aurantimonas sp. C2-3-R2]|uniref:hypothetical protein n=1 Tax=Aurantimonas sp. C2-3-R2 TaxID=3114363 RepID=UPI002E1923E4|nr:hypothetical protein [Aurantimonas sp. C2-3-R2]